MTKFKKIPIILLAVLILALPLIVCKALFSHPEEKAAVTVSPAKVELAFPAILKVAIGFTGSGWKAKEMVVIEMAVPPDVKIPGIEPGEDAGIAHAYADEAGNFKASMETMTKIITIYRGTIQQTLALDPKSLNPIPPGVYTIKASGTESGQVATTTIEFLKPAPKE